MLNQLKKRPRPKESTSMNFHNHLRRRHHSSGRRKSRRTMTPMKRTLLLMTTAMTVIMRIKILMTVRLISTQETRCRILKAALKVLARAEA